MKNKGKVFLVGAGPGDPGLITVKGRQRLAMADVVLYDALVNPKILSWAKARALKIFAGKRGTETTRKTQQETINGLMAQYAEAGKRVVRLKGGDPFLFGRGGEEAEFLAKRKIPFEIVPGVSSITAVPAYAGIPVTDRRYTSLLTVITGHAQEDQDSGPGMDWDQLPKSGTLVILMGVKQLSFILEKLLKRGWLPETPLAYVRWGTLPRQKVVTGTLGGILKKLEASKIHFAPPGVIVVGDVVRLRKKIDWFK